MRRVETQGHSAIVEKTATVIPGEPHPAIPRSAPGYCQEPPAITKSAPMVIPTERSDEESKLLLFKPGCGATNRAVAGALDSSAALGMTGMGDRNKR